MNPHSRRCRRSLAIVRVTSRLIPGAIDAVRVFESEVFARTLLVAVVESCDGGATVNDDGRRSLEFLRRYQDVKHPRGQTTFVNVKARASVVRLVRESLLAAASRDFVDGNALVFYGPNAPVCDSMIAAIGAPKAGASRVK
jgi:hypothetical protein